MKNRAAPLPHLAWAKLTPADLAGVDAVAQAIHVDLFERTEVLFDKAAAFPEGCLKLLQAGEIVGYAIAHPWTLGDIPAIDAFLPKLNRPFDCIYIHDVALLPVARRRGAVEVYMNRLRRQARRLGLRRFACVSVYGTVAYWSRFGFAPAESREPASPVEHYGPTARYMTAAVDA